MAQLNRTVLVVDDFCPDRETYQRYLLTDSDYAYTVLEAQSGKKGLALCQKHKIDAILLDFYLPDIDALEFIQELKFQKNSCFPPIVIITGCGNEAIIVKAIKSGASDFLVKGKTTAKDIRSAIASAIENAELQRKLKASEERFRISVENMLDCFGVFSAMRDESGQIVDFRIDYLNAAALESHFITRADIGKSLSELLPSHYESGLFAEYCQVVQTGKTLVKEDLIYTDTFGGEYLTRVYELHANKLEDGIVVSWRDITQRKQSEIALLESERRFRAIFDSAFQFIGLLAPDGIVLEANETSLNFGGLTRADVLNRPFWETRWWTINSETQIELQQAILRASTGEFVRYEVDVLGADDRVITIDFSLKPVRDEAGNIVLLIPEGRDITDKRKTEEQLQQSQHFIQSIAETIPGLLYVHDLIERCNVYINRQTTELLGYTPEQIQAMGASVLPSLIHPDDLPRVAAHLQRFNTASDTDILEFEYRMQHANGEWHWLCSREIIFKRTELGLPQQIVGICQDITERKNIELALVKANERFEFAASAVNCIIYDWDLQSNIVERSRGLTDLLGYTIQEAEPTSKWWSEIIHPDDYRLIHQTRDEMWTTIATQNRSCLEYRVRHKHGHYIWVQDVNYVVRDNAGNAIRIVGSSSDITQRKLAEESLRENQQLLQTIINAISAAVYVKDLQTRHLLANREFETIFNLSQSEILGKTNYELFPKEIADLLTANDHEVLKQKQAVQIEEIVVVNNELRTYLSVKAPLIHNDGTPYAICGVSTDITERKQIEKEREELLVQAQAARSEAEAANRSKDEFIAVVSHELRSPLNSILGWAKLLQTRKFDADTTNRALLTIERNAKAQSQLIEDLLDISRMVRGNLRLNLTSVNLATVITVALDMVNPAAQAKQIDIQSQLDDTIGEVSGDFNRLLQIIVNLLTNAIKFTPNNGQVKIKLYLEPTTVASNQAPTAVIKVTDTGIGIRLDFLPYVFERFSQADNTTRRTKDGLGLGLAIVSNLVELHGGTISADSRGEGLGATFTVQLPLISSPVTTSFESLSL